MNSFLKNAFFVAILAMAYSKYGPETVENFSGFITVGQNKTQHLFYWFFESRNKPEEDPFVVWMTGGPGCSGMIALFYENGPYIIQKDLSLKLNPNSWNTKANVLWIDQPAGAGFSYDNKDLGVLTENQMARSMYEFLQTFFAQNSKYANLDFYLVGESYAGHYVPALGSHINDMNKEGKNPRINLKGLGIGNGLVDPAVQYKHYAPYAKEHNVVDQEQYELMEALLGPCELLTKPCKDLSNITDPTQFELDWLACLNAYVFCNYGQLIPVQFTGINMYDVREKCDPSLPLCYDFSGAETLLKDDAVKQALGAQGHTWNECNRVTDIKMVYAGDWMMNFAMDVARVLEDGIRVLVYAGEYDFICNWEGNYAWTNEFDWSGHAEYSKLNLTDKFTVGGKAAGMSKHHGGLTFLKVFDAGHMVPMNQPVAALDMINRFLGNQPFGSE